MRNTTREKLERYIEKKLFFGRRVIDDYDGAPGDDSGTGRGPTVFDHEGENGWSKARRRRRAAQSRPRSGD